MEESESPPIGNTRGEGVVRVRFDWSVTPPSVAVIEAIAVATNHSSTALDPLYDYVDPDALDAIVRTSPVPDGVTTVVFTFGDHEVTVYSDGEVAVEPTL